MDSLEEFATQPLTARIALITGGNKGIGFEIARQRATRSM
jgi:NAD(P)-dependent dehydrogenase (short-subunit alcohol dehydrogenase family)